MTPGLTQHEWDTTGRVTEVPLPNLTHHERGPAYPAIPIPVHVGWHRNPLGTLLEALTSTSLELKGCDLAACLISCSAMRDCRTYCSDAHGTPRPRATPLELWSAQTKSCLHRRGHAHRVVLRGHPSRRRRVSEWPRQRRPRSRRSCCSPRSSCGDLRGWCSCSRP